MSLRTTTQIGELIFIGPHANASALPTQSGVYLITRLLNNGHEIIDVGESHNISERIQNHDRMDQWKSVSQNSFYIWTILADENQRMIIERAHRLTYNPVCGDR